MNIISHDRFYDTSVKFYEEIGLLEIYRSKNICVKGAGGAVRGSSVRSEGERAIYQQQAAIRAGTRIRELILANNLKYLWTLTYREEISDRAVAMDDLKKFLKRLRRRGYEIPYVAVMEIQEERAKKYGADVIHFHLATDERIEVKDLSEAWGLGHVFVSKHDGELFKVASYISKYVRKGFDDSRVRGAEKKRYLCSRGLKRPRRKQFLMGEVDYEAVKSWADTVVEYDNGVWMQVPMVNSDGDSVLVNFFKHDFDEKWRAFEVDDPAIMKKKAAGSRSAPPKAQA